MAQDYGASPYGKVNNSSLNDGACTWDKIAFSGALPGHRARPAPSHLGLSTPMAAQSSEIF
jgi:hypothetical protein